MSFIVSFPVFLGALPPPSIGLWRRRGASASAVETRPADRYLFLLGETVFLNNVEIQPHLDTWSEPDCAAFEKGFIAFNKNFFQIQQNKVRHWWDMSTHIISVGSNICSLHCSCVTRQSQSWCISTTYGRRLPAMMNLCASSDERRRSPSTLA